MPEPAHKRQLTLTVYATPLMTPTTALQKVAYSIMWLNEGVDIDIYIYIHICIYIYIYEFTRFKSLLSWS